MNALESTVSDIVGRLRQGRRPRICHPEPVEGSLSFALNLLAEAMGYTPAAWHEFVEAEFSHD